MENEEASSCLKPVIIMVVTQISYSVMNILYKLVAVSGMNLIVFVAYRLMFSAAFGSVGSNTRKSRPKLTWTVLFEAFIMGLFGGTMTQILYIQCLALASPTFVSAMLNLLPGITFVIALCFRQYQNSSSVPLSPHRSSPVLGFLAGLGSSVCFATWLIVQAKMSMIYPCPYSSTALMSCMGSIQSVILAICVERDWNQWKLGWDIRQWTAAYSGIVVSRLAAVMMSWCVQKRGPLFVAVFYLLTLLMVAIASSLFLEEKFTLGVRVLGGVLTVCGLYFVLWGKSKEGPTIAPHASQTSLEIVPSIHSIV